MNLK
jgi:hypothetical protein